MEIKAARELSFIPGTAIGPRYPGFCYHDNGGERVATVSVPGSSEDILRVYFNGGCYFTVSEGGCMVLFEYSDVVSPAVVGCVVGRGRAVLSGVHPEVTAEELMDPTHLDTVMEQLRRHASDSLRVLSTIFNFLETT